MPSSGPPCAPGPPRCSMAFGSAFARAALAGNPSDGYGGAVLAVCVPGLAARAEARRRRTRQRPAERARRRRHRALRARPVRRALVHDGPARGRPRRIERDRHGDRARALRPARPRARARRAGRDGARGRGRGPRHRRRPAGPLRPGPRGPRAHGLRGRAPARRARWTPRCCRRCTSPGARARPRPRTPSTAACATRGRAGVRAGMARLAGHARAARTPCTAATTPRSPQAVDASFDERAALLDLDPRHEAMVHAARAAGASANYAGSGGAIVGTLPPTASSPWRARCARWTARSWRRVCRED